MQKSIKQIIMRRDGLKEQEAESLINEAREQLQAYLDAGLIDQVENICQEYFGLEPDYLIELI